MTVKIVQLPLHVKAVDDRPGQAEGEVESGQVEAGQQDDVAGDDLRADREEAVPEGGAEPGDALHPGPLSGRKDEREHLAVVVKIEAAIVGDGEAEAHAQSGLRHRASHLILYGRELYAHIYVALCILLLYVSMSPI